MKLIIIFIPTSNFPLAGIHLCSIKKKKKKLLLVVENIVSSIKVLVTK